MELTDALGKLSFPAEPNSNAEVSISQALSLPVDFLASFVRNRREAELLLKVSTTAAKIDSLMQSYEMIAFRGQELKEAWDGLWISGEPYVTPAIPVIGTEMSLINKGRYMLVDEMSKEMSSLQDLGRQLGHYIDVNFSVVEELRMEGIDRLAINKLLLLEVEKELARRIKYIYDNGSLRKLSSIKQFLDHLSISPASVFTKSDAVNESKGPIEITTDGSCSTEMFSTHNYSEQNEGKDVESPDSHSFASKCVATQAGIADPPNAKSVGVLTPIKMLNHQDWSPVRSNEGIPVAVDVMLEVKNQSSSASEEVLPRDASATDGSKEPCKGDTVFEVSKPEAVRQQAQEGDQKDTTVPSNVVDRRLTDQDLYRPSQSQVFSQAFQSLKINVKHDSRKRSSDAVHSTGDSMGRDADIVERNSKRVMVPGSFQSETPFARTDSLEAMEIFERHNAETNCDFDTAAEAKADMSLLSCSCHFRNEDIYPDSSATLHSNPLTQRKCTDCGGWQSQSQSLVDYKISIVNRTTSCTFADDRALGETAIQMTESPMLATQ